MIIYIPFAKKKQNMLTDIKIWPISWRAITECFACRSHRLGVHPSVHHTLALCQNGAS